MIWNPHEGRGSNDRLDQIMREKRKARLEQEAAAEEARVLELASEKAEKRLTEDQIDFTNPEFRGVFTDAAVEKDMQYLARVEAAIKEGETERSRDTFRLARILEAIIHEQTELANWLGSGATTIKTSRLDDIANGVDEVVEFRKDEGHTAHLGLGIDVTLGTHFLGQKFERIRKEIESGKLAQVRYFKSSDGSFVGTLPLLPRVIVGAERRHITELARLWVNNKNKELAEHPFKKVLIAEIIEQLRAFREYARFEAMRQTQPAERERREGVIRAYERALLIAEGVKRGEKAALSKLPEGSRDAEWGNNDRVLLAIRQELKSFGAGVS
ncbi:MAG: hypothetical protein HY457_02670 [Parcubacteria group bacterium]|nr:hypothetical protein [Parcubacteria group bacterium]